MVDAALAGARAVMAFYQTEFSVDRKADDSPVSEADRAAEHAIVERLSAAMPDIAIIAEEAASAGQMPKLRNKFLLVDPLDGTREFIGGNGEFTVNIGLVEHATPALGVVLAPALGIAYAGGSERAWKATLNGGLMQEGGWIEIRARPAGPAPVAVASRSHLNRATEEALARARTSKLRLIGSSLKFCLLAEAEADLYPRLGPTMEWDTAAGDAVLRAAGGMVATLDGEPLRYGKTGIKDMRDFENPHFLAAGDPGLLHRLAATQAA
jgi:3'(2'), 5'-bisphosphate nucleotidase